VEPRQLGRARIRLAFSEGGKPNFEPPGWDKGEKKGWEKDNNTKDTVPPGLQRR
jgi:hypothetical protein